MSSGQGAGAGVLPETGLGAGGEQVFGDEVLATAILDRLLHHCEPIAINGPPYRLKNRLKAIDSGPIPAQATAA